MKKNLLVFTFLLFISALTIAQNDTDCGCKWNGTVIPELTVPPCEYTDNRDDDSYRTYAAYECCMQQCKQQKEKERISAIKKSQAQNQISETKQIPSDTKNNKGLETLNAQLESATNDAKNLEDVNTSYDITFEDVLSKKNSNKKPSNQLDDSFLNSDSNANENEGGLDFLTQDAVVQLNNSNWKIDYKDGLQGVITTDTKKVLIPYRKWNIEKYQDGIAKISIDIETEQVCSSHLGSYYASVKEVGYVDEDGDFIDGSLKVITGSFKHQAKLTLVVGGNYDKESADLRNEKEKQECIKKGKEWKIAAKRRYL